MSIFSTDACYSFFPILLVLSHDFYKYFFFQTAKCIFTGDCRIDMNTRRFCPHCRLKKCFAVGMKKDLILGMILLNV